MTAREEERTVRVELDAGAVELRVDVDEDSVTVTAYDEHGDRIGIARCGAHPSPPHLAEVEVTPAWRRRGVGTQLLRLLIDTAAAEGIATLTWTSPADDRLPRVLTEATGAVCARRVRNGRAKSTLFVPAA